MRRLVAPLTIALGLAVLGAPTRALAQPSPDARASAAALFEAGRKLAGEGKFAEACPKLEDSQKLDPGMGTLFYLSECYEKIGRTMSAWVGFREVASQARLAGQGEREKVAVRRTATLEPQLMRLKIVARPDAPSSPSITVTRDGAAVSSSVFGTPVPLDPGAHLIRATASGKEAWESKITLKDPGQTVTVEIPALLDKKPGAAAPPVAEKAPLGPQSTLVASNPLSPAADTRTARSWQRPLGVTLTALGVGALGAGVVVGFLAKSKASGASPQHCDVNNRCDSIGLDLRGSAVKEGNLATGVFVGGAVAAAGGLVLWLSAPTKRSATPTASLSVGLSSASLQGSF